MQMVVKPGAAPGHGSMFTRTDRLGSLPTQSARAGASFGIDRPLAGARRYLMFLDN